MQTGDDGHDAHMGAPPQFTRKALSFLRSLKRNNDREWFRARKDQYERHLKAPMLAVIAQLERDFQAFAPEIVASPRCIYRIYRDTRFASDKTPLKTNIAASFPWRGLKRHQGAGLYMEIAHDGVWVGGGMYAPETSQLASVREHIAANYKRLCAIVESPGFKGSVGALDGSRLQRVPRGYEKDHPAAEYLRHRQFLAGRAFPPEFACEPTFYPGVLGVFRNVAPLVRFLNEPLKARSSGG
jgi:uncharacterized protein (TIGR02453 family)